MTWVKQPDDDKALTPEQARQKFQTAMHDLLEGNDPGSISFRLKPRRKAKETLSAQAHAAATRVSDSLHSLKAGTKEQARKRRGRHTNRRRDPQRAK